MAGQHQHPASLAEHAQEVVNMHPLQYPNHRTAQAENSISIQQMIAFQSIVMRFKIVKFVVNVNSRSCPRRYGRGYVLKHIYVSYFILQKLLLYNMTHFHIFLRCPVQKKIKQHNACVFKLRSG